MKEQTIESSLLFIGEDGKQRFAHDTYKDFFLANALVRSQCDLSKVILSTPNGLLFQFLFDLVDDKNSFATILNNYVISGGRSVSNDWIYDYIKRIALPLSKSEQKNIWERYLAENRSKVYCDDKYTFNPEFHRREKIQEQENDFGRKTNFDPVIVAYTILSNAATNDNELSDTVLEDILRKHFIDMVVLRDQYRIDIDHRYHYPITPDNDKKKDFLEFAAPLMRLNALKGTALMFDLVGYMAPGNVSISNIVSELLYHLLLQPDTKGIFEQITVKELHSDESFEESIKYVVINDTEIPSQKSLLHHRTKMCDERMDESENNPWYREDSNSSFLFRWLGSLVNFCKTKKETKPVKEKQYHLEDIIETMIFYKSQELMPDIGGGSDGRLGLCFDLLSMINTPTSRNLLLKYAHGASHESWRAVEAVRNPADIPELIELMKYEYSYTSKYSYDGLKRTSSQPLACIFGDPKFMSYTMHHFYDGDSCVERPVNLKYRTVNTMPSLFDYISKVNIDVIIASDHMPNLRETLTQIRTVYDGLIVLEKPSRIRLPMAEIDSVCGVIPDRDDEYFDDHQRFYFGKKELGEEVSHLPKVFNSDRHVGYAIQKIGEAAIPYLTPFVHDEVPYIREKAAQFIAMIKGDNNATTFT